MSSSSTISARYTCNQCTSTRTLQFPTDEQSNEQIFVPKNSTNGLFVYSDIHRCKDGFLGINNLQIDKNNAVRSYEYLSLPSEKKQTKVLAGIPAPNTVKEKYKRVRVTGIHPDGGFRLRIFDKHLEIILLVGDIFPEEESAEFTVTSKNFGIILDYYKCDIPLSENVKDWLQELVDILVILPPTKLGLFIDTLRYIQNLVKIPPAKFHLDMLRTILSSHEITIKLEDFDVDFNQKLDSNVELYGEEAVELMKSLMVSLHQSPEMSLQEFTNRSKEETSHLVYMFLLLEQDDLIVIDRPEEISL